VWFWWWCRVVVVVILVRRAVVVVVDLVEVLMRRRCGGVWRRQCVAAGIYFKQKKILPRVHKKTLGEGEGH
jgi:hypothetical protein